MRPLLGTFVEIGLHPCRQESAVRQAFAAIEQVHRAPLADPEASFPPEPQPWAVRCVISAGAVVCARRGR
jgi:hypothetical protein